jgi:hypothetical protein
MKYTFFLLTIGLASCTDAKQSKMLGYGKSYTVTVFGPDTTVVLKSSGKVSSEQGSDGYYFEEAGTGKLVEVTGTLIIREN